MWRGGGSGAANPRGCRTDRGRVDASDELTDGQRRGGSKGAIERRANLKLIFHLYVVRFALDQNGVRFLGVRAAELCIKFLACQGRIC